MTEEKKKKIKIGDALWYVFFIAFIACFVIFFKPIVVSGDSMNPNYTDGDYLLALKVGEPGRGDTVVFHTDMKTDDGSDKLLIKRVIGLPGDVISIEGGTVYVNGQAQDASYTPDGITYGYQEAITVPEDHYFVLGDNRGNSMDSRSEGLGCIDGEELIGRVILRVMPFSSFGIPMNPYK